MEKITVTFAGENRTITMDFTHNPENESLDYSVKVDPELQEGENPDLSVLFANVFLDALNRPAQDVAFEPDTNDTTEENPAV